MVGNGGILGGTLCRVLSSESQGVQSMQAAGTIVMPPKSDLTNLTHHSTTPSLPMSLLSTVPPQAPQDRPSWGTSYLLPGISPPAALS